MIPEYPTSDVTNVSIAINYNGRRADLQRQLSELEQELKNEIANYNRDAAQRVSEWQTVVSNHLRDSSVTDNQHASIMLSVFNQFVPGEKNEQNLRKLYETNLSIHRAIEGSS